MIEKDDGGKRVSDRPCRDIRASAYPLIEVLGEHGLVWRRHAARNQRRHHDFALVEAFKNFREVSDNQSTRTFRVSTVFPLTPVRSDGQWRYAEPRPRTALGVDAARANMTTLSDGCAERYPDTAELVVRSIWAKPAHAPDQIGRIVAADPHRRSRIEFHHLEPRALRIELDLVV